MSHPSIRRPGLAVALAAALVLALAAAPARAGDAGHATPAGLKRVEAKKVCMVNNQVFEKDQIPIEVEGKTYYGCCAMCKERLAKDAAARSAVDPTTGKAVDKAKAVIVAQEDGSVLYFASEETLAKFKEGGGKSSGGER